MKKDLIILGAGASFGSGLTYFGLNGNPIIRSPALGNNLFDDLQKFAPQTWGKLNGNLAIEFKNDFEQGMKILAIKNPHVMLPLQRAMAEYFFNFHPSLSNLYVKLSKRIKASQWNGTIATLNYERLLELSLLRAGIQPVSGEIADSRGKIEFCLPHGCCHIFCSVKGHGISLNGPNISFYEDSRIVFGENNAVLLGETNIKTKGGISVITDPNEFLQRINIDEFPPVMCYYDPEKEITSGANFIDSQKNRLKTLINEAENIAVIGVRVRPNDTHIWDHLEKTNARIIYCGGTSGGSEYNEWKNGKRSHANDVVLSRYFRESLDDICKYLSI